MKTLRPGKQAAKRADWWVDVPIDCPRCGAQFALEEGDKPLNVVTARSPNGESTMTAACPTCGTVCSLNRSSIRVSLREYM